LAHFDQIIESVIWWLNNRWVQNVTVICEPIQQVHWKESICSRIGHLASQRKWRYLQFKL